MSRNSRVFTTKALRAIEKIGSTWVEIHVCLQHVN